jgi:histidinol-phosphate aminotransferase
MSEITGLPPVTTLPAPDAPFVREEIRRMRAYSLPPRIARDKLDQNESPFDWPDEMKRQVVERLASRSWNRYPDFELVELRRALATRYALEPEELIVGNGSNELLLTALLAFAPGAEVFAPVPTFPLYEKITTVTGGRFTAVPLDPRTGRLPVREIALRARACRTPAVVIVCSPNNPTGGVLQPGEIEALLDTGATVLVDRAYGDFVPDGLPAIHPRLVVLSSFSKSAALAGLRIGWLAAAAGTCAELRKVRLPYSLNAFSSEAALVALANREWQDRVVALVVAERQRVAERLRRIAAEVFPSSANFICFRLPNASTVFERLYARGVLLRDVGSYPHLEGCLRVSIGTPEQNDRFLAALQECTR